MKDDAVALNASLRRRHFLRRLCLLTGLIALTACVVLSVGSGTRSMGLRQTAVALLSPILPQPWTTNVDPSDIAILYHLRLPRTIMAVITGAGLAMAGVTMQGITRNPLVSPYTLGISPAAAFGASLVILFGLDTGWMVAGAFASALLCAGLILLLATMRGVSETMLVLGGIGLTYLFTALTATIQFVATEQQLAAIVQWTFGSLNGVDWHPVIVAGSVLSISAPLLLLQSRALNAFEAGGDELAMALGFRVAPTRLLAAVLSVLVTASIVSFVGVIGFVGLVAPHIARMTIGNDYRWLLPFAALSGALLVLLSDLIGRLAFAPVIIPVGIVVAYVGVPLFLHLLLTRRRELSS